MRAETIAIHAGHDADPATKAVAVPICRTATHALGGADRRTALFNLKEKRRAANAQLERKAG
jgi:O-acetylhomoserine (thiol)-lyase